MRLDAAGRYLLLHERRVAEALLAFEEAVRILPREPNTHDSLGEAYLANGEVDAAIASYRRALDVNPRFEPSLLGLAMDRAGKAAGLSFLLSSFG